MQIINWKKILFVIYVFPEFQTSWFLGVTQYEGLCACVRNSWVRKSKQTGFKTNTLIIVILLLWWETKGKDRIVLTLIENISNQIYMTKI